MTRSGVQHVHARLLEIAIYWEDPQFPTILVHCVLQKRDWDYPTGRIQGWLLVVILQRPALQFVLAEHLAFITFGFLGCEVVVAAPSKQDSWLHLCIPHMLSVAADVATPMRSRPSLGLLGQI